MSRRVQSARPQLEVAHSLPTCIVTGVSIAVFSIIAAPKAAATEVTFSNIAPRRDNHGNIMNAHDGTTQQFSTGGTRGFYYHAMGYVYSQTALFASLP